MNANIPEWKVYFNGNFWGHQGLERAGTEIPLNRRFVWSGEIWLIPAVYICSKGLVMDFCVQIPAERIRSFQDKWSLSAENAEGVQFTDEQRMIVEAENPLIIRANFQAVLNGSILNGAHGCGTIWNPCLPHDHDPESKAVMRHYGLEPACGWAIWRAAFPWKTKRKPQINTLGVTLLQEPAAMPGPHFRVSEIGERFTFTRPATKEQHTLFVEEYESQELPRNHFPGQNQEFPTHFTAMCYTLSPDLGDEVFSIRDCARSDQPRRRGGKPNGPRARSSACGIGIIGGARGPVATVAGGGQGKLRVACSALHFEPVKDIEWRMVFREKNREDVSVELIGS